MTKKLYRYNASFVGNNSPQYHIEKLCSDPLYETFSCENDGRYSVKVIGPKINLKQQSLGDLRKQLSKRAYDLNLDAYDEVDKAVGDIFYTGLAHQIILEGQLHFELLSNENNAKAKVALQAEDKGEDCVKESVAFFANWRISCLAQALEMQVNGPILSL